MKTRIIVDSTADMPLEMKERISVVPLTIGFGDQDVISYYYKNVNKKWGEANRLDERYNAMIRCIHELCVHYGINNIKVIHFVGEKKPWMYSWTEMVYYVAKYTLHHERYRAQCAWKYFAYVCQAKRNLK